MIGDALGCGPIEVAFAASEGWVDELGLPRSPLEPTPGASVVDVVVDGAVVARFRCPTHVAFDTDVVLGVERATAIATEHVQLRAGLREQATALAASSRRVLVAADEQRVELSRQLDVSTSDLIAEIEAAVVDLAAHVDTGELQEALRDGGRRVRELRDELDALTSGLGPTALAAGDLRGALAALAATVDVPTALRIDVDDVPPEVASALYFVVAELVTNAVRHAKATTVAITARIADGSIITEVVDDGIGGAHIEAGRGLRGLVDRVDAFGGRIELRSAAGQGTSAVVSLPVSASPTRVHGTA